MKCVITAGPGQGKTTVIELLVAEGYRVVPEVARIIIEEEQLKNSDILPWKDFTSFQELVAERQLELERQLKVGKDKIVFLDRGLVDGVAYSNHKKIPVSQTILDNGRDRYDKVFFLSHCQYMKKIRLDLKIE